MATKSLLFGLLSIAGFPVMFILFLVLLPLVHEIPNGEAVVLVLLFLPTIVFGFLAIASARRDLKEAPATPENVTVRRRMKIGMTLGILSMIVFTPFLVLLLTLFTAGRLPAPEDAIRNDMTNLAHHAFQYRIRPSTMGGGEGSYQGYSIPEQLRSNENGSYREIVSEDTVILLSTSSRNPQQSFKGVIDGQGKLISFESED